MNFAIEEPKGLSVASSGDLASLKLLVQTDFLRATARREAVDLIDDFCTRMAQLNVLVGLSRVNAATGSVTVALDVLLVPPSRAATVGVESGPDVLTAPGWLEDIPDAFADGPPKWLEPQELLSEQIVQAAAPDAEIQAGPPVAAVQETAALPSPVAAEPVGEPVVGKGPEAIEGTLPKVPVAAEPPSVAGDGAQSKTPPRWTAEEDARAIAIAAPLLREGKAVKIAAKAVSEDFGRPFEGVAFRLNTKLREPLRAAASAKPAVEAAPAPAAPSPALIAEVPLPTLAEVAKVAADRAVAVENTPLRRMPDEAGMAATARLMRARMNLLGNPDPFTPYIDFALVSDLAQGIKLDVISADLGIDSAKLKRRWDAMIEGIEAPRGGLSLADQERLVAELKARLTVLGNGGKA